MTNIGDNMFFDAEKFARDAGLAIKKSNLKVKLSLLSELHEDNIISEEVYFNESRKLKEDFAETILNEDL